MHSKILVLVFSVFGLVQLLHGQENMTAGARQVGLGGTGLVGSDIWMSAHNQAGLANLEGPAAGTYFNNRFQMNELTTAAFAIAYPHKNLGTFGLNYTQFGYELFSQRKFAFAYAMRLGKKISAGIQIDYFQVIQGGEYGKQGFTAGEIGMTTEPVDNFFVAAHVFNPWPVNITENQNGELNSVFRLGTAYMFSDKVLVALEAEKDLEYPIRVRFGTEYEFLNNLFLRVGMATEPAEYTFGMGYIFKGIGLDVGMKTHSIMGMHSHFGLSYCLSRNKQAADEPEN